MADPSKTETATPRKREESRKRGQVARSVEVNTAAGLLGAWMLMHFWGAFMIQELADICRFAWGNLGHFRMSMGEFQRYLMTFNLKLFMLLLPLFVGVFLIGVLSNVAQIGFLFSAEPLALKPENLNPAQGFKRLFSRRTAIEFLKNMIKIVLVATVTAVTLWSRLPALMLLLQSDLGGFFSQVGAMTSQLFLRLGLALLGLAALDFWYQRYEFEESIKMSKQEIKDEFKQLEGDPQIKARVRQLQRENSRKRMLSDLPNADVVITNPTHLAVAVQYDGKNMDAPRVVAKGARLMAERIKEMAREYDIPVMENKPLARAIYESTPVGSQVPGTLFTAVAELLAFVYQMQGKLVQKAQENRERLSKQGMGAGV